MDHSDFVKKASEELSNIGVDAVEKLVICWKQMYCFDDERQQNMAVKFKDHCKEFFSCMVQSEEEKLEKLKVDVQHLLAEKAELERVIGIPISIADGIENKPLINKKEYLVNALKTAREIKKARLSQMSELQEQLRSLKTQLGLESSAPLEYVDVPSENDLISVRSQIMELQEDKELRLEDLNLMRDTLHRLISKLEMPIQSFDDSCNIPLNLLMLSEQDDWPLQRNQIQCLKELIVECQNMLERAQNDKESLLQKLNYFWEVNKEDPAYQTDFLLNNSLFGHKTLKKIENEIERCIKIRKDKAKELTLQKREEIKNLWSRLGFSQEKRELFKLMVKQEFSVKMLDEHDEYLKKLNSYYDKYKGLFKLIEDRNKMWLAWVELEKKVLDKTRFNNRGGQLLKEGKERSILEKKLPKIEKEIVAKAQAHLDSENEPFLWQGQEIQVAIDSDHKELEALKLNMKTSMNLELRASGSAVKRKLLTPSGSKNMGCNMVFSSPVHHDERTPMSSPAITPISALRPPLVNREVTPSSPNCIVISSPDEPSCVYISSSSDNER